MDQVYIIEAPEKKKYEGYVRQNTKALTIKETQIMHQISSKLKTVFPKTLLMKRKEEQYTRIQQCNICPINI